MGVRSEDWDKTNTYTRTQTHLNTSFLWLAFWEGMNEKTSHIHEPQLSVGFHPADNQFYNPFAEFSKTLKEYSPGKLTNSLKKGLFQ